MPRYKLLIEYNGTAYHGWQKQVNGKTIEGELESAIGKILQYPVDVVGQGRTDSGVHAEMQTGHLDIEDELDRDRFLFALLGVLPKDIAVWDIEKVDNDFHARFDAKARQYRYQIVTRPSPLYRPYSEMILEKLDLDLLKECANDIMGTHNFESFTKSQEDQSGSECHVEMSEFIAEDHLIVYRIKANRFLRHMVRRIVGSIYQVGIGKWSYDEFRSLLDNPTNTKGGHGASAKGLFLERVEY